MKITPLNWQEPAAYVLSAATTAAGLVLATSGESDWIGRAGSLVIVIGILLAGSRKLEILNAKALRVFENSRDELTARAQQEFTKRRGRLPTAEEEKTMLKEVKALFMQDLELALQDRRRMFKVHEVSIIVFGTLLNGFGPWFVEQIKCVV